MTAVDAIQIFKAILVVVAIAAIIYQAFYE